MLVTKFKDDRRTTGFHQISLCSPYSKGTNFLSELCFCPLRVSIVLFIFVMFIVVVVLSVCVCFVAVVVVWCWFFNLKRKGKLDNNNDLWPWWCNNGIWGLKPPELQQNCRCAQFCWRHLALLLLFGNGVVLLFYAMTQLQETCLALLHDKNKSLSNVLLRQMSVQSVQPRAWVLLYPSLCQSRYKSNSRHSA